MALSFSCLYPNTSTLKPSFWQWIQERMWMDFIPKILANWLWIWKHSFQRPLLALWNCSSDTISRPRAQHTVVIGGSHIVGRPMSILMSRKGQPGDSTSDLTHSRTKDLAHYTREADIVISALGVPNFLTADMVKKGVVIIDVGMLEFLMQILLKDMLSPVTWTSLRSVRRRPILLLCRVVWVL